MRSLYISLCSIFWLIFFLLFRYFHVLWLGSLLFPLILTDFGLNSSFLLRRWLDLLLNLSWCYCDRVLRYGHCIRLLINLEISFRKVCLGNLRKCCTSGCLASFLNLFKNSWYDWFGVKAVNFFDEDTILIVYGGIGKGAGTYIVHAELWILLTVKVIDLETPLFCVL